MSVQMVLEMQDEQGIQAVLQALEAYKTRLRANIERTSNKLREFERRYAVTTDHFLSNMASEDLLDGDLEYVEWAGEARLLAGLEAELRELEGVRYKLP